MRRDVVIALALGAMAALSVLALAPVCPELSPGEPAFRRLVAGATPSGRVPERAVISFPGIDRKEPGEVRLELEADSLRYASDGAALTEARVGREGVVLMELPRTGSAGARIVLAPGEGAPPLALRKISVCGASRPLWPAALAFLATWLTTVFLARRRGTRFGAACGLATASFATLAALPSLVWFSLPSATAFGRLAVPVLLLAASVHYGRRARGYWTVAALLAALVFGAWVRWYFLPSAGSWDTEYWKAWTSRSVSAGVSRVYGDAGATPPGHFVPHLLGREDLYQIDYKGRSFVVDYPPLAMALWRWSFQLVSFAAPGLDRGEAENVAVKLPGVLGDVASVILLLFLFRDRPARGLGLAALYWALPVSWLSSAVLGFLDAAYAPLAVLGLVAAGRGRGAASGILVALAGMVKPQALLMAPAAMAVLPDRRALLRAAAAGLGAVGVALVPFALAGTIEEAVTHVFRILFQQRLSAGFANLWWVIGHFASGEDLGAPIGYAAIDSLPFRAGLLGTALFLVAAAYIVVVTRPRRGGARAAALAGATLVFAYAILAMGVHENHPHAMFLAFAATGLVSLRMRLLVAVLSVSYVLNMLSLSALGRFYGLRYMPLEPLSSALASLRMSPGFDLTLLLALVNTSLFLWLLLSLRRELRSFEGSGTSGDSRGEL